MSEKTDDNDEELIILDAKPIWKDGRILKEVQEIIEYIDAYMKPASLVDHENTEEMWIILRAHLMHMYLATQEERVEAFEAAFSSKVDYGLWMVKRMREKFPEYWMLFALKLSGAFIINAICFDEDYARQIWERSTGFL